LVGLGVHWGSNRKGRISLRALLDRVLGQRARRGHAARASPC
jgi:hypothetical protein